MKNQKTLFVILSLIFLTVTNMTSVSFAHEEPFSNKISNIVIFYAKDEEESLFPNMTEEEIDRVCDDITNQIFLNAKNLDAKNLDTKVSSVESIITSLSANNKQFNGVSAEKMNISFVWNGKLYDKNGEVDMDTLEAGDDALYDDALYMEETPLGADITEISRTFRYKVKQKYLSTLATYESVLTGAKDHSTRTAKFYKYGIRTYYVSGKNLDGDKWSYVETNLIKARSIFMGKYAPYFDKIFRISYNKGITS